MMQNLLDIWPEVASLLLILWILLALLPQRHHKGNGWLLLGFTLLLAYMIASAFYSPLLFGPTLVSGPSGYMSILVRLLEVVAVGCIGIACWQKIKGKVTHHFLKIVSLIYAVLFLLTIGVAFMFVTDETSLQLVLLMMSGVIITILPVIHAFTYSHPHQPPSEETSK